jgi:hypothetical protein
MENEPGYLFEFTLAPTEARIARRRAQFFRVGHATGIFAYVLIILYGLGTPLIVLAIELLSPKPDFSNLVGPLIYSPLGIVAFVVLFRALTVQVRPILPADLPTKIFIYQDGIQIETPTASTTRTWDDFTALIWTPTEYLFMTKSAYLAIPKRVVPLEYRTPFEVYGRAMCLKLSVEHNFPVLLNGQSGFPVQSPTSPDSLEPPHQKNL